jgi:opacity protein-like surface antigen
LHVSFRVPNFLPSTNCRKEAYVKKGLIAGAVAAAALWGGAAAAQSTQAEEQDQVQIDREVQVDEDTGTVREKTRIQGELNDTGVIDDDAVGGSSMAGQDDSAPAPRQSMQTEESTPGYVDVDQANEELSEREKKDEGGPDMRGLTVTLGGGVEGYTGQLAPNINPGPGWGVTAGIRPTRSFGVELMYQGAYNTLQGQPVTEVLEGNTGGASFVRNGGQAVLTLGLPTAVQPYALAGVGINRYSVASGAEARGLRDDTAGNVPVGGGLRSHIGDFTVDARAYYNVLFANEFASGLTTERQLLNVDTPRGGSYVGQLQLGTTF